MYLAKIEEYFFKYRGQGTVLSPRNWLVAERWENMGIPLHIVCKGIKKTCQQFRSTHQEGEERIDILTYCEPVILKLWKDYRSALLGSPGSQSTVGSADEVQKGIDPNSAGRLSDLKDMVRKRLMAIRKGCLKEAKGGIQIKQDTLLRINWAEELDHLEAIYCGEGGPIDIDIDGLEKRLRQLDNKFLENFFSLLAQEEKENLREEAEKELSPYKEQMDKESYSETLELSMKTQIRERFKIRRISLYST